MSSVHSRSTSPAHSTSLLEGAGGRGLEAGDRSSDATSSAVWYDDLDTSIRSMDNAAKLKAVSHLQTKIQKTREKIKIEQNNKEDNVDEYLRLSGGADKHQQARIKQVFEKKNQKSAQNIQILQKKLESYQKKSQYLEHGASNVKQTKEVLKAVGHGIKSVGEGVVDTLTRPREIAHLIRNKFGSADNIPQTYTPNTNTPDEQQRRHYGSASLPREGSISGSTQSNREISFEAKLLHNKYSSDDGHASGPRSMSSMTSESERGGEAASGQDVEVASSRLSATTNLGLRALMSEITNLREETERAHKDLEEQRQNFKQELELINGQLREERFKFERLEEQINDMTELHQNEMENIKCGVTDMEEKVQYQSEERIRDIHDQLAGLETKISRIEHQASQHLQYVSIGEGLENSNARVMVVKAINVFLVLLQVILLILETGAQILKPFVKTPTRTVTTVLLITVTVLAFRQWQEVSFVHLKPAPEPRKKTEL